MTDEQMTTAKPRPKIVVRVYFGSKAQPDYYECESASAVADGGMLTVQLVDYRTRKRYNLWLPFDRHSRVEIVEPRMAWEGRLPS